MDAQPVRERRAFVLDILICDEFAGAERILEDRSKSAEKASLRP